jgi:hypothetical protein
MAVKANGVNVALQEHDIEIVTALADKLGLSFSGAIRVIIRDWDIKTNPRPAAEPQGAK